MSSESSRLGGESDVRRVAGRRRWPAEWEAHRATWLAWPHNEETWPGCLDSVEDAFVEMVRAILPGEAVEILVPDKAMAERAVVRLRSGGVSDSSDLRFHVVPTDDAWIRDHGGLVVEEGGARLLLDFKFDAWGGKYPPWDQDAKVAGEMARIASLSSIQSPVVLEAGSIDGDGEGTILTTESCLLNPNRMRPGQDRSKAGIEALFKESLGASHVLWLGEGLYGDDTDGHVDDLTRFVSPGRVVTAISSDPTDVDFAPLKENRVRLEAMVDTSGRSLDIVELPTPKPIHGPEGRLPASYANFYFANHAVLVPVFGVEEDREALDILARIIRDRPIVPIPSRELVMGLGAVHCLTQQEPLDRSG